MSIPRRAAVRLAPLLALSGALASAHLSCTNGDDARECRIGADCASGVCGEDGRCVRGAAAPDGGDGGLTDVPLDAGPELVDATPIDAALPGCMPNGDGLVTREEVPLMAGLRATFRVAQDETISTAGAPLGDGGARRLWSYATALGSDQTVTVETLPLAGKWYGPAFAGATYAARLAQRTDLLGVFEVGAGGATLRGVVSPTDGPKRTELAYDPPPVIVAFPMKVGSTWKTKANITGVAPNPYAPGYDSQSVSGATEEYESEVDAAGQLTTPFGTFEVLRVRTLLTRKITYLGWPVSTVRIRSFAFVAECFGTVASVTSEDDETEVEFTHAAELRRIAP